MSDTEEFCENLLSTSNFPPGVTPRKLEVTRYKGELEQPQWVDLEPRQYNVSAATGSSLTPGVLATSNRQLSDHVSCHGGCDKNSLL